jgi:hypothetical protein
MKPLRVLDPLRTHRPRYADVASTLALLLALGGTAYAAGSLGPHTVGTPQLKSHAVTAAKLHLDAVTHSKLAPSSVDGSDVAPNSLALADLVGADINGQIGFTVPAGTCGSLNIGASGAKVGQVVLFSFTGDTTVPASIVYGGTKVIAASMISVRVCNVGSSSVTASNLGIRVVTFG